MAMSGKGATITFGSSAYSLSLISVDMGEASKDPHDVTALSDSKIKRQPGDVEDPGQMTIEYYYDQSVASPPANGSAAETITVTFPLKSGEATAANTAGTGFVCKVQRPTLAIGTIMRGKLTIQWSGATGPTHTAGS